MASSKSVSDPRLGTITPTERTAWRTTVNNFRSLLANPDIKIGDQLLFDARFAFIKNYRTITKRTSI